MSKKHGITIVHEKKNVLPWYVVMVHGLEVFKANVMLHVYL